MPLTCPDKEVKTENKSYREIKLFFPKYSEHSRSTLINFVPIVYQERADFENNKLLIFDIPSCEFKFLQPNNPSKPSQKFMYEDDQ